MAAPRQVLGLRPFAAGNPSNDFVVELRVSGFSRTARVISVLIQPGAIAFTRMPSSANEMASDLVSETTALLAALYPGAWGAPKYEYIEPMLMRQPLLSFKCDRNALASRRLPTK